MVWHASMVVSSDISPPSIWTFEFTSKLTVSNLIHELFIIVSASNSLSLSTVMNPLWLQSVITTLVLWIFSLVSLSSHFLLIFQRKWTFAFGKCPKWLICSLRSTYSRFYNWDVFWIKNMVPFVIRVTCIIHRSLIKVALRDKKFQSHSLCLFQKFGWLFSDLCFVHSSLLIVFWYIWTSLHNYCVHKPIFYICFIFCVTW